MYLYNSSSNFFFFFCSIQHYLQDLQKSADGLEVALKLLQTDSPNCQFFGALTYTVQINLHNNETNNELQKSPESILDDLFFVLIYLKNKENSRLVVIRKLLSTLARFFTKFYSIWPECIPTVISAIALDDHKIGLENKNLTANTIQKLNEKNAVLCLEFCQMLIEDTHGSGNLALQNELKIGSILKGNIDSLVMLLDFSCQSLYPESKSDMLLEHIFKTYSAWSVNYLVTSEVAERFLPITHFIFNYINSGGDSGSLFHIAIEEVAEILERYPKFFSPSLRRNLGEILVRLGEPLTTAIERKNEEINKMLTYSYEKDDEIEEIELFTRDFLKITVSLCEAEIGNPDRLNSNEISKLFEYLLIISNFPGVPYVDHNLSMYLLEFWGTYSDSFLDGEDSVIESNPIILRVIEVFWNKSCLPSQRLNWNFESSEAFYSFRRDFWEFLELTYPLVGASLFKTFVQNILENLNTERDWIKIEASLSCVTALSDSIPLGNEYDYLSQLLSSVFFSKLSELEDMDIRTTAVNFVGSYDSFFELDHGKPFLFGVLDYLFKSLSISKLSNTASKSIQKLCSSCRSFLSNNLDDFFQTYNNMRLFERLDNVSHQRTVFAISCVIQALKNLESKALYSDQLLTIILKELEKDSIKYSEIIQSSNIDKSILEISFDRIVSLLKCISSIGKGLQEPDDVFMFTTDELSLQEEFWACDKYHIRSRIVEVIKVFAIQRFEFNMSYPICEACCEILKSGFSERVPGPFVFSSETSLEFIKAKGNNSSDETLFPLIVDFSNCFVTSVSVENSASSGFFVNSLLELFYAHLETVVKDEPEMQSTYLKFFAQIIGKYMNHFVEDPHADVILKFASSQLSSQERFVIRESTKFWCIFIQSKNEKVGSALNNIGPIVMEILVSKISGDSARSELNSYADVIKQFMARRTMMATSLLENALLKHPTSKVNKIDQNLRNRTFHQLVNLRGRKETNNIIKEYWLSARGITDYL